eukprot:7291807-Karenia_brevis.AAC.1
MDAWQSVGSDVARHWLESSSEGPNVGTDVVRHWCSRMEDPRTHRYPYRYRPGPIALCRPT